MYNNCTVIKQLYNVFLVQICGELSSYSDSCSSIVLKYSNEIYQGLKKYFSIRNVCLMSRMCPATFQRVRDYEVRISLYLK